MRSAAFWPTVLVLSVFVLIQAGCAVPQPPGNGLCTRLVEPETHTGYWLYLPEDYVKSNGKHPDNQRWPVVLTLHGLKPYDNANPQVRCWQQEADRYGFIVIAPELRTCDSLTMQYPLRDPTLPYVQKDDKAIIAIMDEVFRRTNADPSRVLATSFSSGGYMAHFIVNRHPERFRCLAPLWSNFSESLLDAAQIPKYRDMKVGIFFGENDFNDCRKQSTEAFDWYRRYRFDVEAKKVAGLGHERRPQVAAAFFASAIGVTPKTPPELGAIVMQEVLPAGEFRAPPRRPQYRPAPIPARPGGSASPAEHGPPTGGSILFSEATASPRPASERTAADTPASTLPPRAPATVRDSRKTPVTPKRPVPQSSSPPIPAHIRIHGQTEGPAPLWVSLSIEMPPELREGASVLWIDNGRPISSGTLEAQSVLWDPGEHTISAHLTLADDRKATLRETITVLTSAASQPSEG